MATKPPLNPTVDSATKRSIITTLIEEYPNIIPARIQYLCEHYSIPFLYYRL